MDNSQHTAFHNYRVNDSLKKEEGGASIKGANPKCFYVFIITKSSIVAETPIKKVLVSHYNAY